MPENPLEVERKIHFYRVRVEPDRSGATPAFNVIRVLGHINGLPFSPPARYLEGSDNNALCCWIDNISPLPARIFLANVRRSGLPALEQTGRIRPLSIPATSGLAEQTHIIFFPEMIVGAEFNFYGPRISRLAVYFSMKAQGICPSVTFEPLLRRDVLVALDRLGELRLINLKISRSFSQSLSQADSDLSQTFDAALRLGESEDVEIVLRSAHSRRATLGAHAKDVVRRLARRDDMREHVRKFTVRAYDPAEQHVVSLDLLNDQLIATRRMLRRDETTRALDSGSAFVAIEDAYRELRPQLRDAIGSRA
jgi:hypothetical protein